MQLVALIESLQFRKIGRVYSKPTSRIQMLQNVTLALQAIADDHIKLVNIGESESDVLQKVALALQSQRQQQLKGALPWERFVAPALQQEVRYAALERLTSREHGSKNLNRLRGSTESTTTTTTTTKGSSLFSAGKTSRGHTNKDPNRLQ